MHSVVAVDIPPDLYPQSLCLPLAFWCPLPTSYVVMYRAYSYSTLDHFTVLYLLPMLDIIWYSPSNLPLIHHFAYHCLFLRSHLFPMLDVIHSKLPPPTVWPSNAASPNVLFPQQTNRLEVYEYITHTELVSVHNSCHILIALLQRCAVVWRHVQ